MTSLRCNLCWVLLGQCPAPVFTTCGHIICEGCRDFETGESTICPVCRSTCATIAIPPNLARLPSSVRWCFESPDTLLARVTEALHFQQAHEQAYTHALRHQLRGARRVAGEMDQLTRENARLREREREQTHEMKRLRETIQRQERMLNELRRGRHSPSSCLLVPRPSNPPGSGGARLPPTSRRRGRGSESGREGEREDNTSSFLFQFPHHSPSPSLLPTPTRKRLPSPSPSNAHSPPPPLPLPQRRFDALRRSLSG